MEGVVGREGEGRKREEEGRKLKEGRQNLLR